MIRVKDKKVFINTIDNENLSKGAVTATVQEVRIHGGYDRKTEVSVLCLILF